MGSSLEAFNAGYKPDTMPTKIHTAIPRAIQGHTHNYALVSSSPSELRLSQRHLASFPPRQLLIEGHVCLEIRRADDAQPWHLVWR